MKEILSLNLRIGFDGLKFEMGGYRMAEFFITDCRKPTLSELDRKLNEVKNGIDRILERLDDLEISIIEINTSKSDYKPIQE